MEVIELKLDESNEIFFNVHVEGTSPGSVNIRMVCESELFSTIFPGKYTKEGEVKVLIPEMKITNTFKEDKQYNAFLEVMIENRYFIPLKFSLKFKESLKVFAEVSNKNDLQEDTKNSSLNEIKDMKPSVVSASFVRKDDIKEERNKNRQDKINKNIDDLEQINKKKQEIFNKMKKINIKV